MFIEIEKILERTIHEVEILVETEVGQDSHSPNLEEKTGGLEIGQCQDQNQDPGPGQVLESVLTEIELDVTNAGIMISLLVGALTPSWMKTQTETI